MDMEKVSEAIETSDIKTVQDVLEILKLLASCRAGFVFRDVFLTDWLPIKAGELIWIHTFPKLFVRK